MRRYSSRGFTLVEILIVVIILGILAAIVIPQFSTASSDARYAAAAHDIDVVNSAVLLYKAQHNDNYPDLSSGWTALTTQSDANGGTTGTLLGPYLQAAPVNPFTNGSTVSNSVSGLGSSSDWFWDQSVNQIVALDPSGNRITIPN
jgi:general secretion pathway protein G